MKHTTKPDRPKLSDVLARYAGLFDVARSDGITRDIAQSTIKADLLGLLPEKRPKWDVGEYQVIEDALGNKAEELYEDIRTGFNDALDQVKAIIEEYCDD